MYGAEGGYGYDHDEMSDWSAYQSRWNLRCFRAYDMSDTAVKVLRRADLLNRTNVVLDSVTFQINLPEQVTGDINPQTDPFAFAEAFKSAS
jgi:hypothetical protein